MCSQGCILCLGNPLLDVSANVDAAFLKKYDVSPDSSFHIAFARTYTGVSTGHHRMWQSHL